MPLIIGKDPNWQSDIAQRWGNALTAMQQIIEQKRAKEDRDLQRNLELLAKNPILADTLGNDLISKYGKKRPEIVSLVTTLQQQKKLQQESEQNLSKYQRAYAKEVGDRQRAAQGLEQMPDELQQPMDQFGTTVPIPNMTKQVLSSQMAMLPDPQWSAFAKMSDEDKYAVQVAMLRNDLKPPTPPKNLGPQDLSDAMQGLMASGYAPWSQEGQTTAKSQAGLQLSPEEEQKVRLEQEKNKRELQERLDQEKRTSEEQRALIKEREQSQMRLTDYRDSKKSPSEKASPKEKEKAAQISDNLEVRVAGSKARKRATPDPKLVAKAKRDNKEPPPQPPPTFPTKFVHDEVAKMALDISDQFGADPDSATAAALQLYDKAMANTHDPGKALDLMRKRIADDKALLLSSQ